MKKLKAVPSIDRVRLPRRAVPVGPGARTVAVLDIGANAMRVTIADIDAAGQITPLELLHQPVHLGRDSFTVGIISRETTAEVIEILKRFGRVMAEYGVTDPEQIYAVTTSAVREASNREAFLDRVYIATGIDVVLIDEAEETRLTYQSIQPYLATAPKLAHKDTLVVEMGGGNTELLLLRDGNVLVSHSYRLGALRMREMLEHHGVADGRLRKLMENEIDRAIQQIAMDVPMAKGPDLLVLGGEARLAASLLVDNWDERRISGIPLAQLEALVDELFAMTTDDIVRKLHILFSEAETLGPTLLAHLRLARACGADRLYVCKATMRDGLLVDMAVRGAWSQDFFDQIVRSSMDLGRRYEFNEKHGMHVAGLSLRLFAALAPVHGLSEKHGRLLYIAAMLHEIGMFINQRSYHKHSMYLILNSQLFGMGRRDLMLTALVARYHRRAEPRPTHVEYTGLVRGDRIAVAKLASILRVVVALERSRCQRVRELSCRVTDSQFIITVAEADDLSLERLALQDSGRMFEDIFGISVVLREDRQVLTGMGMDAL